MAEEASVGTIFDLDNFSEEDLLTLQEEVETKLQKIRDDIQDYFILPI